MAKNFIFTLLSSLFLTRTYAVPIADTAAQWTDCPSTLPSNLRCTTASVPMDYSGNFTEQLTLNLIKLPAGNLNERRGSLVWQFGGPGEPTSDTLIAAAESDGLTFSDVQTYFDIVVADPRGVGLNYPVKCDPALARERLSYFPTSEAEYDDMLSIFGDLGESCLQRTGNVMNYMDTQTQARDLEAVRIAIGEGKLNYCKRHHLSSQCEWSSS